MPKQFKTSNIPCSFFRDNLKEVGQYALHRTARNQHLLGVLGSEGIEQYIYSGSSQDNKVIRDVARTFLKGRAKKIKLNKGDLQELPSSETVEHEYEVPNGGSGSIQFASGPSTSAGDSGVVTDDEGAAYAVLDEEQIEVDRPDPESAAAAALEEKMKRRSLMPRMPRLSILSEEERLDNLRRSSELLAQGGAVALESEDYEEVDRSAVHEEDYLDVDEHPLTPEAKRVFNHAVNRLESDIPEWFFIQEYISYKQKDPVETCLISPCDYICQEYEHHARATYGNASRTPRSIDGEYGTMDHKAHVLQIIRSRVGLYNLDPVHLESADAERYTTQLRSLSDEWRDNLSLEEKRHVSIHEYLEMRLDPESYAQFTQRQTRLELDGGAPRESHTDTVPEISSATVLYGNLGPGAADGSGHELHPDEDF